MKSRTERTAPPDGGGRGPVRAAPAPGERAAAWSYLMLVALPFVLAGGFVALQPREGDANPSLPQGSEWVGLALAFAVMASPFVVGMWLGARARRTGARQGTGGLILNAGVVLFLFGIMIVTNLIGALTYREDAWARVGASIGAERSGRTHLAVARTKDGAVLADDGGRLLYTMGRKAADASTRTGHPDLVDCKDRDCATWWTPVTATTRVTVERRIDPDLVAAIQRTDGPKQLVYDGHPLYVFRPHDGRTDPFRVPQAGGGYQFGLGGDPQFGWYLIAPDGSLLPKR